MTAARFHNVRLRRYSSVPVLADAPKNPPRASSGGALIAPVTELAVDAQGLAWTMFARGPRSGEMALGALRPEPSVLWALGRGEGGPLLARSRWSAVPKR